MPDTLDRELARVIDASADPVSVEEVLGLPAPAHEARPVWPMLAAAVVLVAAAVAGVLVAAHDEDRAPSVSVATTTAAPPTTVPTPPLLSCVVLVLTSETQTPCTVTDAQATQMIGFEINEPEGIPAGWTRVYSYLSVYLDAEGDFPGDDDLIRSRRTWYHDPEAQEVPCTTQLPPVCPGDQVQVTIRRAFPRLDARDVRRTGPEVATLDNGAEVHGTRFRDEVRLRWLADGRLYDLRTYGLPFETVIEIAESLA